MGLWPVGMTAVSLIALSLPVQAGAFGGAAAEQMVSAEGVKGPPCSRGLEHSELSTCGRLVLVGPALAEAAPTELLPGELHVERPGTPCPRARVPGALDSRQ